MCVTGRNDVYFKILTQQMKVSMMELGIYLVGAETVCA